MKTGMVTLLAIAALTLAPPATAISKLYSKILSDLWAEGTRLEQQGDFIGAQKVYEQALSEAQKLPDSLVKRCSIAHSRIELETMIAIQQYLHERGLQGHGNDPGHLEGIEITKIQQFYATWENVGRELNLSAQDCP